MIAIDTPAGFTTPSNYQDLTATVSAPDIFLTNVSVGKDMQVCTSGSLEVAAPTPLTVTLTVANASLAKLTDDPSLDGTASLSLSVSAGSTSLPTFCVQALAGTGSVQYTATASGYDQGAATITLNPSGFVICSSVSSIYCGSFGGSITTSLANSDTTLKIAPVRLDPTYLNFLDVESLRPGIAGASVTIASTNSTVGTITVSPVTFSGYDIPNERVTSFHPMATGTTHLEASAPGFSTASNNNDIVVTVTP